MSVVSAAFGRRYEGDNLPPIKLDLATQRLLIQPDDLLPQFYPRPKAVMITPIYDDADIEALGVMGPTILPHNAHPSRPYGQGASTSQAYSAGYGRHRPHSHDDEDSRGRTRPTKPSASKRPSSTYYKEHGRSSYDRTNSGHSRYDDGRSPTRTPPDAQQNALQRLKERREQFHEAIRNYLKIIPTNPKFCRSCCTGRKKAVCIGINYIGQKGELKGCANDARAMRQFLIQQYHFPPSEILLLTDDDRNNFFPTREEMFKAMQWLVSGAKKDDSLFFHWHGGQTPDEGGRELDGMDETIFPVDHSQVIDDELYKTLVEPLPPGCRLTALFDSCHSGTVLDLPYIHSAHGRLRGIRHVSRRARKRGVAPSADVICFSACKDDETAADTFSGNVAVGAMSHAFVESLEAEPNQTYDALLAHLRGILIPRYEQKAQISCTIPLELEREFTL